jgi:hypothetical protein
MADDATAAAPDPAAAAPAAPDPGATATATPPAPVATDAPDPTQMIQGQAPPDPNNVPIGGRDFHESWGARIYHGIMGALGGTQDTSYQLDSSGKMQVSSVALGPGTQWKRIIAGAVQGAASGLGTAPGPGQLERAVGAGFNSTVNQAQQVDDKKRAQATQNSDQEQKTLIQKAQTQLLTYQGATAAFQLARLGVTASQEDSDRENAASKLIQNGGQTSQMLGVAPDFKGILAMHKDMPNLAGELAKGNIVQWAHVDANGKYAGVGFGLVTQQWKEAKLTEDTPLYHLVPPTKVGDQPTIEKEMVSAGSMSNLDFSNKQTAFSNEIMKWQADTEKTNHQNKVDAASIGLDKAKAAQAYGEANKQNADAEAQRNVTANNNDATMAYTAKALATGEMLYSDLPKRTSKGQPSPQEQAKAANDYSMQNFGLPYDPRAIAQENKFATSVKVQGYLDGIDRMTGIDGQGGQLAELMRLAKVSGMSDNAPISGVKLAIERAFGATAAKNFNTQLLDTQASLGTLVGNPLLGSGESDKKLKLAEDAFGQNPSLANLKGQVATVQNILNGSRTTMAKSNRFIQQRYGTQHSPASATGKINVQIPGHPPGQIPASNKAQFLHDNPGATVLP